MIKIETLHIMAPDKFLAPFIDFIDEHFGRENHHYVFITSEKYDYGLTPEHNVEFLYTDDDIFITLPKYMLLAKKIILHGLWRDKVDILLYFNQKLLKKCYWVMWGGDFYFPETKSKIKHKIIEKMGNYISSTKNDIDYIKKMYHTASNNLFFSQFYPTRISDFRTSDHKNKTIKILVGNSSTKTNRHKEVFQILEQYKNNHIEIIVPLNYGDINYKKEILELGNSIFGNKFIPIIDFMDFEKYKNILLSIDIAIFNNNRQQSGGNIKLLIGYGKKIYLSNKNSFYRELKDNNVTIYDIEYFNLEEIDSNISKNNIEVAKNFYSLEALIKSWSNIFES